MDVKDGIQLMLRNGVFKNVRLGRWYIDKLRGVSPFPIQAKIEITRRCNLNCGMCLRPHIAKYPDMEFDVFKSILDEIGKNLLILSPHGYGEPVIHPRFQEFMEEVWNRRISIVLVTNGTLLTPEVASPFIRKCKPWRITFSVDAGEKEAYERIRKGAKFEEVVENISNVVDLKKKYGVGTTVSIYCTVGKYNHEQVIPLSKLASQLGVDEVSFTDLTIHGYGLAEEQLAIRKMKTSDHHIITKSIHDAQIAFGKKLKVVANISKQESPFCRIPWELIFIQVNGDVFPCTDTLDYRLGNIFEEPIDSIWNGAKMDEFRQKFLSSSVEECRRCVRGTP
jgi:MoaA/NifB/PqqE/SkfB family radical SAM enzyme